MFIFTVCQKLLKNHTLRQETLHMTSMLLMAAQLLWFSTEVLSVFISYYVISLDINLTLLTM
jgi:hypothetical protein